MVALPRPSARQLLAGLPFERELIERGTRMSLGDIEVRVCHPEDLIILKAVAGRARDWGDIEGVLAAHSGLDLARIRHWLDQFAAALETPELLEQWERLLQRAGRA